MKESPEGQPHGGLGGTSEGRRQGGWEAVATLPPSCPASFLQLAPTGPLLPPSLPPINWVKPVEGIGKRLCGARVGAEDTPSFLLVTGSYFQYIFQALVMPEMIMLFLSTQEN